MFDVRLPDLTFPNLNYGKNETPWDLKRWLYKGGAKTHAKSVATKIESGRLGRPLMERMELAQLIHEALLNFLDGMGRRDTVRGSIEKLNQFFKWADETKEHHLSLSSVEQCYRHWCDTLLHRSRVGRELQEKTAYEYGTVVGGVLDKCLARGNPIVMTTPRWPPQTAPLMAGQTAPGRTNGL